MQRRPTLCKLCEEVDWINGLYLQAAGALEPLSSDGHRQMIVMGVHGCGEDGIFEVEAIAGNTHLGVRT